MTCHVAMVGVGGAVMLSDSQSSDDSSEAHGTQKLICGEDFLFGGTGSNDLISAITEKFIAEQRTVSSKTVAEFFPRAVADLLVPEVRKQVEFVIATEKDLYYYQPGRFTRPQSKSMIAFAGSGAEFVSRAWGRDLELGIVFELKSLADTFVAAEGFMEAANESLTVDDKLMVGLVSAGRSYSLGHRDIYPRVVPQKLRDTWNVAADHYEKLKALSVQIRAEMKNAQQALGGLQHGELGDEDVKAVLASNDSIRDLRLKLNEGLVAFMNWYDELVGRPVVPRPVT